jgi:hypothetical protein
MPIIATALVAAVLALLLGVRFSRARREIVYGPRLYQRFGDILAPYEGQSVPPEHLSKVQARLNELFFDALTGVGLVPSGWDVHVVLDDVLGPVAQIHGQNGEVLSIAEFEQRVREGQLDLDVGAKRPKGGGPYRTRPS